MADILKQKLSALCSISNLITEMYMQILEELKKYHENGHLIHYEFQSKNVMHYYMTGHFETIQIKKTNLEIEIIFHFVRRIPNQVSTQHAIPFSQLKEMMSTGEMIDMLFYIMETM